MTKQLKPCPFCASTNLFIDDVDYRFNEAVPDEQQGIYNAVVCYNCNARGSEKDSEKKAIWAWNTRITHELKILPKHFKAVEGGDKKSEIRFNDQKYLQNGYVMLSIARVDLDLT
ncbi:MULTISPECIES: Lar family restriction alleviation protein [unclassified Gilliamella]|uniref:Lar family restriction alleviation protein n=1 Tax=unclassified Gilliamella TaxID=2685620 RepID=UPI002269EAE2|nr:MULTISPECIES: Lar family restriction alleviation protein [unclassified Gilliamella]MCX8696516.1 Lar family restriction alleviation protein [Gilliamella sp. B2828]MCX8698257.1 Lar family restriction alleviation protein [Gilliamella sp. B3000]